MSALQWWTDAGVDMIVGDEPRDWLRPRAKAAEAVSEAAPQASGLLPATLDLFTAYLRDSDHVPLAFPGTPRVAASGDPQSGLMMMVDMPAEEDCRAGVLLAGATGQLFDRMLAAIGRNRQSIYLSALSCVRSPSGALDESAAARCGALARHHVGLVQPAALLLFGDVCARALLGLSVAEARGRWHALQTPAGPIKTLVTLNPARLIDHPRLKAAAWADLQMLMEGPT